MGVWYDGTRVCNSQTDWWTGRKTVSQTDRDRQTGGQAEMETDGGVEWVHACDAALLRSQAPCLTPKTPNPTPKLKP